LANAVTRRLFNPDSAIETGTLCASRGHRGPCGRNEQENQSPFGWSPLCPQSPRGSEVSTMHPFLTVESKIKVAWRGSWDHTMRKSDVQPKRIEQKDRVAW